MLSTDSMKGSFSPKSFGLLLIRLAVGAVFVYHGWGKLTHIDQTTMFFTTLNLNVFFVYLVGAVELLGGIAMILGVFTCIAGWLLAIVMLFAIILVKSKMGFMAAEIDMVLLAASLGIAFAGSGRYSLMKHCNCKWCSWMHGCGCKASCDNCTTCTSGACTGHEKAECKGCCGGVCTPSSDAK